MNAFPRKQFGVPTVPYRSLVLILYSVKTRYHIWTSTFVFSPYSAFKYLATGKQTYRLTPHHRKIPIPHPQETKRLLSRWIEQKKRTLFATPKKLESHQLAQLVWIFRRLCLKAARFSVHPPKRYNLNLQFSPTPFQHCSLRFFLCVLLICCQVVFNDKNSLAHSMYKE